MGSNDADGRDPLGRFPANETTFCAYCEATQCGAKRCDELCSYQCMVSKEKKRNLTVANAVKSSSAQLWTEQRAEVAGLVQKLDEARESGDLTKISAMVTELEKMQTPNVTNAINLHSELAGALAAAATAPYQLNRVTSARAALASAMRNVWMEALKSLSQATKRRRQSLTKLCHGGWRNRSHRNCGWFGRRRRRG